VLIVTMILVFALAGITLALCRSMRVEIIASANYAAGLQASAIERGAEQYILAMLTDQGSELSSITEDYFAAIPVGDGYFWVLRPDYGDSSLPLFGLVDESSKLNINSATYDQLMMLPCMTDDVAAAVVDWHDEDSNPSTNGAEDEVYLSLPDGYYTKNAAFETVEELMLVRGVTAELLYGVGEPLPLGIESMFSMGGTSVTDDVWLERGISDLLTVYGLVSSQSSTGGTGGGTSGGGASGGGATGGSSSGTQQRTAKINVNTAPREVLLTLTGLDTSDVDKLISARQGRDTTTDAASTDWVNEALGSKASSITSQITGQGSQFSALILAVSGNGRAFKLVRIVIETSGSTPQIVYRRDLTERGWPMEPEILTSLRAGQGPGAWGAQGGTSLGGLLR